MPIPTRFAAALLAAAVATAGCTTATTAPPGPSTPARPSTSTPASGTSRTSGPSAGSAVQLLDSLAVKGRAPRTGYSRARFGQAWSDDTADEFGHNGCDTRNDILRRDLTSITLKPGTDGCVVLTGTLRDPYTGRGIAFVRGVDTSTAVQIDHVVALSNAWQTGAAQWSDAKRLAFANDPLELLAVDGPTNESKGDGDAATWLPPDKAFRCTYVGRQAAVKARYGLWVTPAEHDAMARVLAGC